MAHGKGHGKPGPRGKGDVRDRPRTTAGSRSSPQVADPEARRGGGTPPTKPRPTGDVKDRPRVRQTAGTTPPVTVAQVKADTSLSASAKETIIKAIQAKRGQGGGSGR